MIAQFLYCIDPCMFKAIVCMVTGGEIGQLSAEMLLRSIPIFKERGMTLEEFLMEVRRRGWSEEVIAFCTANW